MMHTNRLAVGGVVVAGLLATILPGPAPVGAQEALWPEAVQSRARALVAERWHLAESDVVLEWGPASRAGDGTLEDLQLLGAGRDGHWVARVTLVGQAPVSVRLRAGYKTSRAVSASRISRGTALVESDIEWREWTVWDDPIEQPVRIVEPGWVAQRAIDAGVPLEEPAVRPPLAVASGDPVEAWWRQGAVGLRVVVTAAGSGLVGDRVYVRTDDGQRLEGVVVAPGVVNIITGSYDRSPGAGQ